MKQVGIRQEVTVRPYRDDDESSVLSLLDVTLGGGPAGERPVDFFRWKHLENPAGRSFMLVAELDGELVGFRSFMRWRFVAGGTQIRAVRAVDTATHPDHQGRGIFSTLTLRALEDLRADTDLVFNTPNESSLPGYLKMGWRTAGRLPVWIRVRRPLAFARGLHTVRSTIPSIGPKPDVRAPRARTVFDRANELSKLLDDVTTDPTGIATPMDLAYLDWRYGRAPLLSYHVAIEEQRGQLAGVAFFRVRPRGLLWETTLSDVIVRPGDRRTAGRLIGRAVAASSVHHVTCHFPDRSPQIEGARRHGFLRWRHGEVLVVNPLHPDVAPRAAQINGWSLSLGTLEVF
jgi:GNAT superfamily N-acetyltransferase